MGFCFTCIQMQGLTDTLSISIFFHSLTLKRSPNTGPLLYKILPCLTYWVHSFYICFCENSWYTTNIGEWGQYNMGVHWFVCYFSQHVNVLKQHMNILREKTENPSGMPFFSVSSSNLVTTNLSPVLSYLAKSDWKAAEEAGQIRDSFNSRKLFSSSEDSF